MEVVRLTALTAALLLTTISIPSLTHAKVYQCTDSQGQVTFTNLPCANNEEKKALKFTETQGAIEVDDSKPYIDTPSASPMCLDSVENAHYTLDGMLKVSRRNYEGGYMTKKRYEEGRALLQRAKRKITLKACESSTGADRAFFECMESGYQIMPSCAQEYDPPLLDS